MRIVSLSPSVTETLAVLGLEDEIVGVTPWCRPYLERPMEKEIAGTYLNVFYDVIERLRPDIVFLQSRVHDRYLGPLSQRGFRTHLVPLPRNFYDIVSHVIIEVGSLVGMYREARELGDRVAEEVLGSRVYGSRRVYIEYLWPDKTYTTSGSMTYIDDVVRLAGGLNIFHDTPREFFVPEDRDVLERDPEIVLVNIEPYTKIDLERYLSLRRVLRETRAYREEKVFLIPESREVNLAHFGPSITRTIRRLREIIGGASPA